MDNSFFVKALEGTWRFNRIVTLGITMKGTAQFSHSDTHKLCYREEGNIIETQREFMRAYDYVFDRADLTILYADGPDTGKRFLNFENLIKTSFPFSGKSEHLCGKDHYAADFTFASETAFSTHYDILGPEKAHKITTDYQKL